MSQLTTHILDTSKGKPAAGVSIILYQQSLDEWTELASGITNADGRIPDFLPSERKMEHGIYKMRFETKSYFDKQSLQAFYPFVEVVFEITSADHYHVPLLLNPFGYSTYRGS
ncbi:MAG: uraH [Segetibacter sp.]|nr:uraH [Segetibacter sp.]